MDTFLLVSAIQGYVVSLAIYKGIQKPNRKLGYYLLLLILTVSSYLLISSQQAYVADYPRVFFLSYVLFFLYSPIYYLFVKAYLGVKEKRFVNYLISFTPAVVYLVFIIWNLFLKSGPFEFSKFNNQLAIIDLISISVNYYLFYLCWKSLKKINEGNSGVSSRIKPFYIFTFTFALVNTVWLLFILPYFFPIQYKLPLSLQTVYATMSIIIYVFTYALIVNKELLSTNMSLTMKPYAKTAIKEEDLYTIEKEIRNVLSEEKLYKNSNFSLSELSVHTSIDKLKLSYTINHHMKTTFNTMINAYRVEEFIHLYTSSNLNHFNTLGIANEAGFKSKSTFYKAFKEITNKTPKEFFDSSS